MKVLQNNTNNTFGFSRYGETQDGVDEKGLLAQGYQWGDAMHWDKSVQHQGEARNDTLLSHFDKLYADLAQNIINHLNPKSVLDLGCGAGQLTHILRTLDRNILTVTVDANQETRSSPYVDQNHFVARTDKDLDFTDEKGNVICFDVIISLEHFEHIPPETFETFMANISKHSSSGSTLLFTAAQWEYKELDRKHVHCNVRCGACWQKYCTTHHFFPKEAPFRIERCIDTIELFTERRLPSDDCPCGCGDKVKDCIVLNKNFQKAPLSSQNCNWQGHKWSDATLNN